jgi:hypothetical protein
MTAHWTVEEASRWLTCAQPVELALLQKLGKDCSMVCRIRNSFWVDKPVAGKPVAGKRGPTERAYPVEIIREVFLTNPQTAQFVPKGQ